ncbi:mannose-1-phosphate guanylyltransferase/mannose-6-phosphate isomerase [Parashewanella hymeniacidonis]|uniref:mannose-1-phosphate guanylyltransferase/mannose-6-phosphate isomerase n=1 Tax=Parashewanella hymeniacidonis TaxID=2807618 RepID=UPI003B8473A4
MIPVIMSGGSGTRLWPQSRALYPKQFLPLVNEHSMLQNTLTRLENLSNQAKPIIIANEEHRFIVAEQLRALTNIQADIILEPVGKNTAPAITLAALQALSRSGNQDSLLLVLAADHDIKNPAEFINVVEKSKSAAIDKNLVTFGIVPTHAETGYGYIKSTDKNTISSVECFVEKPDAEKATAYIESGDYFWNSGMFLFSAKTFLEEISIHNPEILKACKASIAENQSDMDFIRIGKQEFEDCPSDSIDYAVMEKTTKAVVAPLNAGWSDVGSWSALWDLGGKDENNNVVNGDVILHSTKSSYIRSEHKLIATVGVENLVISESDDAILIAHKDKVQDVKHIVNQLKAKQRSEAKLHRKVYRPWGCYDSIDNGERFQVKRITVNPGEKLSVQMHHHRAEHWIVVSGTAKVTLGEQELLVTENQSTYIKIGEVHALENPGKIALHMIEVQTGTYLGEDDIVRLKDRYGR